jgi:hypothetical protein
LVTKLEHLPGLPAKIAALLPLVASWNDQHDLFPWERSDTGMSAKLPFGECIFFVGDPDAEGWRRVEVRLTINQPIRLHSLEIRYRVQSEPGEPAWVPYLRPSPDFVIADQVFRSPAIVLGSKGSTFSLVPDLDCWPNNPVRTWLDLDRSSDQFCVVAQGMGAYTTSGHVMFKKSVARKDLPSGAEIRTAHFLNTRKADAEGALRQANTFIWRRFRGASPQVLPFSRYEKAAVERIFSGDLYRTFEFDRRPVAALVAQTLTARRRPGLMNSAQVSGFLKRQTSLLKLMAWIQTELFAGPRRYRLLATVLHAGLTKVMPMATFGCWFNQVRTALGARLCAERNGWGELREKTDRLLDLALAAPTEKGLPASVCFFPEGESFWKRGTRSFEVVDSYHLPDAAVTGFHLLEWNRHVKLDSRILDCCHALSSALLGYQTADGSTPSWVKPGEPGDWIDTHLAKSAATAAPAMFWARHHLATGDRESLAAAKLALKFIETKVLPTDDWSDYELLLSCAGRFTGEQGPDPYTGCRPANTLSMYWAARASLDVHEATGQRRYLELTERIVDRLNQYQQAFDHPGLSINTFGGFGVMNVDAEFNDARQGLFVPLYLDLHRATGNVEYLERGVAALRACFTTMLIERQKEVAPGNMARFRPSDRGAITENYGHTGRDEPTAGYLSPHWGCGTALYAAGMAFKEHRELLAKLS